MEFGEKLQELRKKNGLTQEELAQSLYVSRTAISKWESGRGYPSIDSLKAIAKFFSVSIDELLSTDEVLTIAEEDGKQAQKHFRDLSCALLEICSLLLLFLPIFAKRGAGTLETLSLLAIVADGDVQPYLKAVYLTPVIAAAVLGIITLALKGCQLALWQKSKTVLSLTIGAMAVLLFTLSLQPYAAIFSFVLLAN